MNCQIGEVNMGTERKIDSAESQDMKQTGMGPLAPLFGQPIPPLQLLQAGASTFPHTYQEEKENWQYTGGAGRDFGGAGQASGGAKTGLSIKGINLTGEFKKGLQDIMKKQEEAREPHEKRISEVLGYLQESEKKMDDFLEAYKKDVEKRMSDMEKVAGQELPKPPRIEDVERPKNLAESIIKVYVPIVVGISALFRGDKFGGYNYFYFNSMMDSLKKNDMESYQKLLQQWKIDYEYAKERKQSQLEVAKLQLQKLETTSKITSTQYERQARRYAEIIKNEEKALEAVDKAADKMEKHLTEILRLNLEEAKFLETQRYHNIMAAKGEGKEDLRLHEDVFKIVKDTLARSPNPSKAQVRDAVVFAFKTLGIPLQNTEEFENYVNSFSGALGAKAQ